ncbi:transposase [Rhodovulum sulfidophilum]|nr:transposase [Rhodovulum sulfidophilum]
MRKFLQVVHFNPWNLSSLSNFENYRLNLTLNHLLFLSKSRVTLPPAPGLGVKVLPERGPPDEQVKPRRHFTAEFKEQAAARLSEPGASQTSVARELGVTPSQFPRALKPPRSEERTFLPFNAVARSALHSARSSGERAVSNSSERAGRSGAP